jgi:hypothetical protein
MEFFFKRNLLNPRLKSCCEQLDLAFIVNNKWKGEIKKERNLLGNKILCFKQVAWEMI